MASAKQVWSRTEGYPGDASTVIFFFIATSASTWISITGQTLSAGQRPRGFTGIKYYRITGPSGGKAVYDLNTARQETSTPNISSRRASTKLDASPRSWIVRPSCLSIRAELFGHWWYEGVDFLNFFVRKAYYDQTTFDLITPGEFCARSDTPGRLACAVQLGRRWYAGGSGSIRPADIIPDCESRRNG